MESIYNYHELRRRYELFDEMLEVLNELVAVFSYDMDDNDELLLRARNIIAKAEGIE